MSGEGETPRRALTVAHEFADTVAGHTLRSAIAAIPFVGGSLSVIIESRLAAHQAQRIDTLYRRLAELEAQFTAFYPADGPAAPYSEELLESATAAAVAAPDPFRARMLADLLFCMGPEADASGMVRRLLVEICASLSPYELALLMRFDDRPDRPSISEYGRKLLDLQLQHPELDEIREYSVVRLRTFRLVTDETPDGQLTRMGRLLVSAV